jgi:hypothetical protein
MRHTNLGRGHKPGFRQATKRSFAARGAFEYLASDELPNRMFFPADCHGLAGPLQRHFHVSEGSGIESVCNDDGLAHGLASRSKATL